MTLTGLLGLYLSYNLQDYRQSVESTLSTMLERPIRVAALAINWQGMVPVLAVSDLEIQDQQQRALAGFKQAELSIDLARSMQTLSLQATRIRIHGATLSVHRDAAGTIRISGLGRSHADADADAAEMSSARRLLLGPTQVDFSNAKLLFYDARLGDQPPLELGLHMEMRHSATAQVISGVLKVPGRVPQVITLNGQLSMPTTGSGWLADLRIAAHDLHMQPLASLLPRSQPPGSNARADFELKLRFTNGQLTRANGNAAFRNLELLANDPLPGPRALSGEFRYGPVEHGWQIEVTDLVALGTLQEWRAASASIRFKLGQKGRPGSYTVKLSNTRLEDVLSMVAYLEPGSENVTKLRAFQMTGAAKAVSATWLNVDEDNVPFTTAFTFESLGWPEREGENWGLRGLSGYASLSPSGGAITLDTRGRVTVSAAGVFARPPVFNEVSGSLNVRTEGDVLSLTSQRLTLANEYYQVHLIGNVVADEFDETRLAMRVEVPVLATKHLTTLLPSPLLPNGLNKWLSNSVSGGQFTDVKIHLNGKIKNLSSSPDNNSVEFTANLKQTTLAYAADWPSLQGLNGSVSLKQGQLTAKAKRARLGKSLVGITATINNVEATAAPVRLHLTSTGTVANMLATVLASPLAKGIPPRISELDAAGSATIDATIDLSTTGQLTKSATTIKLKNVSLTPGQGIPPVSQLNGTLKVRGQDIKTGELNGRWLGNQVSLNLASSTKGSSRLSIAMPASQTTLKRFAKLADITPPAWLAHIDGTSQWHGEVTATTAGQFNFEVNSQLVGTHIELPAPIGKTAKGARELRLSGSIKNDVLSMHAQFGVAHLDTIAELGNKNRLGFNLNFNRKSKPATFASSRIGGSLSLLDVDAWADFLDTSATVSTLPSPVIDIKLGLLRFAGLAFPRTRVSALRGTPTKPRTFILDGPNIAGRVVPPQGQQPLRIDLERLIVPDTISHDGARTNPRRVPSFTFLTKHLVLGDVDLGNLKLSAIATDNGLRFDSLYLISPLFDLSGTGAWTARAGKQQTNFAIQIHADELRNVLLAAGVQKQITNGGATRIDADLRWPGTPGEFSLHALDGEIQFQASGGRILNLDAGPGGKIFALLNLRSLPQILSLDFGSVLSEGLEYKRIRGTFTLNEGNAYTNDLTLRSRTAKISIAGRTGMIAEDYDQIVHVRPSLTDSLPVAGAIFGGVGAGVGAAIWLAEKLLNSKVVDEVASFKYTIVGPWENPKITRDEVTTEELGDR